MTSYHINDPRQGLIGPVRLETVLDLVAAGVIRDDVEIAKDGGPFLPITAYAELRDRLQGSSAPRATFAGDLGKHTFFKVFYRFSLSKASGALVVQDEDRRKDVYLEAGQPVFVASNLASERLGRQLVQRGKLTPQELSTAVAAMQQDNNQLGRTIIRLGLMEPLAFFEELRLQQEQRLLELCRWRGGHYLFFDGKRCEGERLDLGLDANQLMLAAARSMPLVLVQERLAPLAGGPLERLPHAYLDSGKLGFTADEQAVLSCVDGARTMHGILERFAARGRAAYDVLYLLWEIDALGVA